MRISDAQQEKLYSCTLRWRQFIFYLRLIKYELSNSAQHNKLLQENNTTSLTVHSAKSCLLDHAFNKIMVT